MSSRPSSKDSTVSLSDAPSTYHPLRASRTNLKRKAWAIVLDFLENSPVPEDHDSSFLLRAVDECREWKRYTEQDLDEGKSSILSESMDISRPEEGEVEEEKKQNSLISKEIANFKLDGKLWVETGLIQKPSTNQHRARFEFPLPEGDGLKRLNTMEDFKLPYGIYAPTIEGEHQVYEWKHILKSNQWVSDHDYKKKRQPWNACSCTKKHGTHCGPECLNRSIQYECSYYLCSFGHNDCGNRLFSNMSNDLKNHKLFAEAYEVRPTEKKGLGLFAARSYNPASLIVEYTGEIIDLEEVDRRLGTLYKDESKYYFLGLETNLVIDAGRRGSVARFVNHSCDPNCEMQKWYVDQIPRIGLFAKRQIYPGEEITYDYNFEWYENSEPQKCYCSTNRCRGVIGKRPEPTVYPPVRPVATEAQDDSETDIKNSTGELDKKRKSPITNDDDDDDEADEDLEEADSPDSYHAPSDEEEDDDEEEENEGDEGTPGLGDDDETPIRKSSRVASSAARPSRRQRVIADDEEEQEEEEKRKEDTPVRHSPPKPITVRNTKTSTPVSLNQSKLSKNSKSPTVNPEKAQVKSNANTTTSLSKSKTIVTTTAITKSNVEKTPSASSPRSPVKRKRPRVIEDDEDNTPGANTPGANRRPTSSQKPPLVSSKKARPSFSRGPKAKTKSPPSSSAAPSSTAEKKLVYMSGQDIFSLKKSKRTNYAGALPSNAPPPPPPTSQQQQQPESPQQNHYNQLTHVPYDHNGYNQPYNGNQWNAQQNYQAQNNYGQDWGENNGYQGAVVNNYNNYDYGYGGNGYQAGYQQQSQAPPVAQYSSNQPQAAYPSQPATWNAGTEYIAPQYQAQGQQHHWNQGGYGNQAPSGPFNDNAATDSTLNVNPMSPVLASPGKPPLDPRRRY